VGAINQNGTRLIHSFGTNNFFAGLAAGNFTMTGGANTASGMFAFQNNTTGSNNTASVWRAAKQHHGPVEHGQRCERAQYQHGGRE
jgi:hypothetical protein